MVVINKNEPRESLNLVNPIFEYEDIARICDTKRYQMTIYTDDSKGRSLDDVDINNLRVAYYDYDGTIAVSEETAVAVENAVKALEKNGASISKVSPPDLSEATMVFFSMAGADGGDRTWKDLQGCDGRHHKQFQDLLDGFGSYHGIATTYGLHFPNVIKIPICHSLSSKKPVLGEDSMEIGCRQEHIQQGWVHKTVSLQRPIGIQHPTADRGGFRM